MDEKKDRYLQPHGSPSQESGEGIDKNRSGTGVCGRDTATEDLESGLASDHVGDALSTAGVVITESREPRQRGGFGGGVVPR